MRFAPLLSLAGCISAGGGVAVNHALDDSEVRPAGAVLRVGTMAELAQDRAIGQLLYTREIGPLGGRANSVGLWGARITTMNRGNRPGVFAMGSYGSANEGSEMEATSLALGAGIAYSRIVPAGRARAWTSLSVGLVYHRQRQLDVSGGALGDFFGLELGFMVGLDTLGPMFRNDVAE
ncbi:MAG: hypothetical protein SFX73_12780 [Kofleriaceae bacterium]|nr:hypothetical protein [Kofleriaceae bacterium]